MADLELGYDRRGVNVVECDGKRSVAATGHLALREAIMKWAAAREERERPWWKFWK